MRKQEVHKQEVHKRKAPVQAPSTGRGADSAMDALIKSRVAAPGQGHPPHTTEPKKH